MGYETIIKCDQCATKAQVPSPGATPPGWVLSKVLEVGAEKPSTLCHCSWTCASIYAQVQVAQRQAQVQSVTAPHQQGHLPFRSPFDVPTAG